jgi:bacterial leucyl aminopeptidase
MRHLAALALIVGCSSGEPAETGTRYITIGADAVATARSVSGAQLDVLESNGEIAVLAVDAEDLEDISHAMHEQHHRCGGYMLHDSLEDARAALEAPPRPAPIEYTLDRAEAVNAVLPTIEPNRILDLIGELSNMKTRHYQSESGAAASEWLRDHWKSFAKRSDITFDLVDHGWPQRSVIMTIPGTTRADEVIVIGGHLDSISMGGRGAVAPGADDDASGIATLTEVARVLLAKDYRPERTIKFMAYAAEEVGLRGSQAIAKDFKARGINVVGALQLDMTNFQGSERDIWLMKDFTNKRQNDFVIQLIETYTGATYGLDACGYACSDHASWHRTGVPASMPFESRMNDRNREIHTKRDTLEKSNNNANHAVKFARLATAYAIELGKGSLGGAPDEDGGSSTWTWLGILAGLGVAFAGLRRLGR